MRRLILDLETAPIVDAAEFITTDDISAPSNWKDPEKIQAYCNAELAKRIESAALDFDTARICMVGTGWVGAGLDVQTMRATTEDEEIQALQFVAASIKGASSGLVSIVTFNGTRFDLPMLERRARYLGVDFPDLRLDDYKTPHVDVYDKLTGGRLKLKAHPLWWYVRRHRWQDLIDADPFKGDGSKVGQAVAEGRWEDVQAHCEVDVKATFRLAKWLRVI